MELRVDSRPVAALSQLGGFQPTVANINVTLVAVAAAWTATRAKSS